MSYSIVDCTDGRFAVMAGLSSGSVYWCDGFFTLAEAETCVDTLRALMAACGAPLVRRTNKFGQTDLWAKLGMPGP